MLLKSTANRSLLNRRAFVLAPGLAMLAQGMAKPDAGAVSSEAPDWLATVEDLVRIETWRETDSSNETQVVENLRQIKARLGKDIDASVASNGLTQAGPDAFEWRDPEKPYWVFGWRVGSGARKMTIISHLDTVPPGDADWRPFEPRIEQRPYQGAETDFLVGRGTQGAA